MDTLAATAADLEPALKRIGGYLRENALRRYKEQGFAPLSQATLDKRAAQGLKTLERKLTKDFGKAKRKAWDSKRAEGSAPRGALARTLARLTLGDLAAGQAVASTRGVQNRLAVLDEFKRRHRSGVGGKALSVAQTKSLNDRETRAVAKQVGKPILGGLTRTLNFKVARGSVTLKSETYDHFSEVHNKGNSTTPARTTIKIDETDLAVFKAILVEELLMGFGES